jgi:Circularly permutated YpsA SLOG family
VRGPLRTPLLVLDPGDPNAAADIQRWLSAIEARTLNVAGPSEGKAPGIGDQAYSLLVKVFASTHRPEPALEARAAPAIRGMCF